MKVSRSRRAERAVTLFEVMIVICVLIILAIILLPVLSQQRRKVYFHFCSNNLKQTGLAFRIWEGDHNDKYPMAVSVTNGGAMEAVTVGNAIPVFQVMSNELSTPWILLCPQDSRRHAATNFNFALTSGTVSYFVNPDAVEAEPQDVLCGDDNFEIGGVPVKSGLLRVSTNTPFAWTRDRHKFGGYVGMADGSAQIVTNAVIKKWFFPADLTNTTVRLAIP